MTLQEVWSLLNLYNSVFSGEQIDEAIGIILNGGISAAVDAAEASAAAAAKSASDAAGSAASVGSAATNAQNAANRASGSATEAESWAVGGTGSREGEDEDNAKYYAEVARQAAGGGVLSVDGVFPDESGNVATGAVKSINGFSPDEAGNFRFYVSEIVGETLYIGIKQAGEEE